MSDNTLATTQPTALLMPAAQAGDIIRAHEALTEIIAQALVSGRDYGKVTGIDKPFLFKPGAERLSGAYGLYPSYEIIEKEIDHDRDNTIKEKVWNNKFKGDKSFTWGEGKSQGLYRYVIKCTLRVRGSNVAVAEGIGSCSTMEDKYISRPRNLENTALKMAEKRAYIAATLHAFALSDRFSQDEDAVPANRGMTPEEIEAKKKEDAARALKVGAYLKTAGITKGPKFEEYQKLCKDHGVSWMTTAEECEAAGLKTKDDIYASVTKSKAQDAEFTEIGPDEEHQDQGVYDPFLDE